MEIQSFNFGCKNCCRCPETCGPCLTDIVVAISEGDPCLNDYCWVIPVLAPYTITRANPAAPEWFQGSCQWYGYKTGYVPGFGTAEVGVFLSCTNSVWSIDTVLLNNGVYCFMGSENKSGRCPPLGEYTRVSGCTTWTVTLSAP